MKLSVFIAAFCLAGASLVAPMSSFAETVFSVHEGFLDPKKPKIVKQPRNSSSTCTISGGFYSAFRVDRKKKGKKVKVTVSFQSGMVLKGTDAEGKMAASGKFQGDSWSLSLKDSRKGSGKATITLTRNWGGGFVCQYPFSGTMIRTDYLIP